MKFPPTAPCGVPPAPAPPWLPSGERFGALLRTCTSRDGGSLGGAREGVGSGRPPAAAAAGLLPPEAAIAGLREEAAIAGLLSREAAIAGLREAAIAGLLSRELLAEESGVDASIGSSCEAVPPRMCGSDAIACGETTEYTEEESPCRKGSYDDEGGPLPLGCEARSGETAGWGEAAARGEGA